MKSWAQIAPTFPAIAGPAREKRILDLVKVGNFVPPVWETVIVSDDAGNALQMYAAGDALALGTAGDSVRANVNHQTAQHIADWYGWVLPTAKMIDDVTLAADFIDSAPLTSGALWQINGAPTSTDYMVKHSRAIDARAKGAPFIGGPWKQWINGRRLSNPLQPGPVGTSPKGKRAGLQYGFFSKTHGPSTSVTGKLKLWQPPGATHWDTYTDYSEKFRPFSRWAWLSPVAGPDRLVDLAALALDEKLNHLISHEGPVAMHHPWLPLCEPLSEGGACGAPPGGSGGMPTPTKPPSSPSSPPGGGEAMARGYSFARLAPLVSLAAVALVWKLVKT